MARRAGTVVNGVEFVGFSSGNWNFPSPQKDNLIDFLWNIKIIACVLLDR